MKQSRIALVAALAASCAWAGTAHSQIWIGQIVGEMAAQEAQARQEAACRAGAPASDGVVAKVGAQMDRLMTAYLALKPTSDTSALGRVFAMKTKDVRWRDASGETPLDQLGDRLGGAVGSRTLVAEVVAGDGLSGRAVWSVTPAGDDAKPAFYAVDYVAEDGHWPMNGWRIRHMSVLPADNAPPTPGAYCHYNPDQSY